MKKILYVELDMRAPRRERVPKPDTMDYKTEQRFLLLALSLR